jgi:hypothetical protein
MFQSLICTVIIFINSVVNASTPDLAFQEALKHAAASAGDLSSEQVLLHEIADRIKPETISNITPSQVETNGADPDAEGAMDKQILNQSSMDIEPVKPFLDNPMMFVSTSLSAGTN